MALALKDRVKETTIVVGTGAATLLGSSIGFQPFSVVGNGNTTYYCISDQFGSNWEVGIGTYTTSGNTLARTTVLSSSNAGALVVFTAGIKDVFVTYPAEKGVWLDASGNAIGLGTPAAFVGTNITGTASGLTAGNVTTNANLTGAVTSSGNATSLGSFTSLQLATALTNETGTGSAVFSDNASLLNPTYTGTLTGSTGILNIGSGQVYKDASGNVGIGTTSPSSFGKFAVVGSNTGGAIVNYFRNSWTTPTANTQVVLSLDAGGSGYGVRDSQIKATNNGANQTTLEFYTANAATPAEHMRIDSAGNVGIGTSSPSSYGRLAVMTPTATYGYFGIANSSGGGGGLQMAQYYGTTKISYIDSILSNGTPGSETAGLAFATASVGTLAERMRIDSSGNLLVGTTSQLTPGGVAGVGNIVNTANNGSWALALQNNGSTAGYGRCLGIRNATDFNTGSSEFIYCVGGGNARFFVQSNGGIYNYSANNSNLSDERVKKDIEPAPSWLNKINAIEVVNFKYKDQTHDDFNLGVIAQQVEAVAPELINIDGFGETPEDGIPLKSIYETDLVYAMLKSIQELKAIIDTQQEQINSLLGK